MGYAIPITQAGGGRGMPVYAGERRQMGGNLFGTIKRIALPLLRKLLPLLKTFGKRAAGSALNIGTGLAGDLIAGKFKEIPRNLRKRGRREVNSLSRDYLGQDMFQDREERGGGEEGEQQQTGSGKRLRLGMMRAGATLNKAINRKRVKRINNTSTATSNKRRRQLALDI